MASSDPSEKPQCKIMRWCYRVITIRFLVDLYRGWFEVGITWRV
jgi:hypothetical protein